VRTNKIPRQVPEQAWYMHPAFSVLIGGILPFGAVFIELFFILTSMWLHQVRLPSGRIRCMFKGPSASTTHVSHIVCRCLPAVAALQQLVGQALPLAVCGIQRCLLRSVHPMLKCMLLMR
jgi:Endomembrane protein 70